MKNKFTSADKGLPAIGLLILLLACGTEDVKKEQKPQSVNAFRMLLNGAPWEPSRIGQDECMRTFGGAWSSATDNTGKRPYYTVWAYQDPRWESEDSEDGDVPEYESDNIFLFQVMDVWEPGRYSITGSYKDHISSYARFHVQKPGGTSKLYVNKANSSSFVVEISEICAPLSELPVNGIKGSFYGTLYNEANPQDSLTIRRGEFTLKKINWYNFNQCPQ